MTTHELGKGDIDLSGEIDVLFIVDGIDMALYLPKGLYLLEDSVTIEGNRCAS